MLLSAKNILLYGMIAMALSAHAQDRNTSLFLKKPQSMAERWELERKYHKGVFVITPYKPVYVTAGRYSDNPNKQPVSENPAYSQQMPVNYNNYEAKFQFSLKTKVIYGMFHNHADLWVAYTQKAHWQIYNTALSRPFRELNYEPELILNFPVRFTLFGLQGRMVGISLNHQSNGQELPLSRSWNRIIGYAGFEKNNFQMTLRGWYRIPDEDDENPLIADYTGRGEGVFVYNIENHQVSLVVASALRPKYPGRGSVQLNWVFPVVNNFRMQLQMSEGYGETLVDYNHRQATIGLSVALIDW